jgi:hypothetical protein
MFNIHGTGEGTYTFTNADVEDCQANHIINAIDGQHVSVHSSTFLVNLRVPGDDHVSLINIESTEHTGPLEDVTISNCRFERNEMPAVRASRFGAISISNSRFFDQLGQSYALFLLPAGVNSNVRVINSSFTENMATPIFIDNRYETNGTAHAMAMSISGCEFLSNHGISASAIYTESSYTTITISGTTFYDNSVPRSYDDFYGAISCFASAAPNIRLAGALVSFDNNNPHDFGRDVAYVHSPIRE